MQRRVTNALASIVVFAGVAITAGDYPDPARFQGAIDAFTAADQVAMPPQGAIVATGSSSMRGWHGRIADDLAPLTVIPRGFGGSNMHDVRVYLDELVLRYKPRAVLLYEGDNDVAVGVSPQQIAAEFDAIDNAIATELPGTRIYILAVKPSIARWQLWPTMQAANALLAAKAVADPRITFIDVATPMLDADSKEPKRDIFIPDMLHMNDAGYDIWRDAVRPVLVRAEAEHEQ